MLLIYYVKIMSKKIKWYYFRKGWTTCVKASKFLEANSIEVLEEISASKKLNETDAKNLLKKASKIMVFKGKKTDTFNIKDEKTSSIVPYMLGPTGNLRAPTLIYNSVIIVGFNEEKFNEFFS